MSGVRIPAPPPPLLMTYRQPLKDYLYQKILDTISKHRMIKPGNKILLAVSGGADSVALLYILYHLREELSITLSVAHLNHDLRGEESERDAAFVKAMAGNLNLPVIVEKRSVKAFQKNGKISLEEAARKVRYRFLSEISLREHCQKIALAHSANDQAETVLMKLLRGAGLQGLSGIAPVKGPFIRPLIDIERPEIEGFLNKEHILFRTDSTNFDTTYLRNRVRLELLPLLKQKFNPQIIRHLKQLSEIIREEDRYLASMTAEKFGGICRYEKGRLTIILSEFNKLHDIFKNRILRQALQLFDYKDKEISFTHIYQIRSLIDLSEIGKVTVLPAGIVVRKYCDVLIMGQSLSKETKDVKLKEEKGEIIRLNVPGETIFPGQGPVIQCEFLDIPEGSKLEFSKESTVAYFDYSQIDGPLELRTPRPGDRFQPLGMRGSKKLHDFFIDGKISREERTKIPLLLDNKGIIWVIGKRISERCKIREKTCKILIVKAI
ncbi:MAG: tRNA lysidine(34) synthetase TilS [Candidatus Tectomicrobia bacterium]|uniref:tRNA(Ile)-lysidine synthase n=1 Tax=Tectimicrobiota bacterium TaxID=2528274 RepID=A0A933GLW7_UNCTE|nr:tRNA lysidine(34) synthetase TilS [Candidatus Tectomicrobia bacterium]